MKKMIILFMTVLFLLMLISIEDSYFKGTRHGVMASSGGRYVFRHNEAWGWSPVDAHGLEYGALRGTRSWQVYENTPDYTPYTYPHPLVAPDTTEPELLFRSGFESNSAVEGKYIVGQDETTGYDWDLLAGTNVPHCTSFHFYNEYGTNQIIDGSALGRPGKIMHFNVYPPDGKRASVHMYFDGAEDWTFNYTYRYWMYIPTSFNGFKALPDNLLWYAWSQLFEWKNCDPSNSKYGSYECGSGANFRGHIRMKLSDDRNKFFWIYRTEQIDSGTPTEMTYVENQEIEIPFGEWFLVEIYLKEGDENNGRLIFRQNGETVLDVVHSTYHSLEPKKLRLAFPLKLYWFSPDHHNYVDDISYYYDDFEIWRGMAFSGTGP